MSLEYYYIKQRMGQCFIYLVLCIVPHVLHGTGNTYHSSLLQKTSEKVTPGGTEVEEVLFWQK